MDVEYESFVWDAEKEWNNLIKHGVDFQLAAEAFSDPHRKIFVDCKHSREEERLYCIGKVKDRILTVRFTYRQDKIRIIGAGIWRKGRGIYEERNT